MVSLEVGRVCVKIAGREAGKYCVVVRKENNAFVIVTGPKILTGVKRRRSNIAHLEPTQYIIEIPENASDEVVLDGFEKAMLITKLGLKKPSAATMKAEKAKVQAPKVIAQKEAQMPKEEKKVEEEKTGKERRSKREKD